MSKRDIFLALLVILAWGIHFPVIKTGTNEIPGLMLVTIRFLLTGLVFLPFCKNLTKLQFKQILIFSAYYYMGHLATLFLGLRYLESATVALIMQAQVPLAMLLGWAFYAEKFKWKTSLGLGIAFIGLLFIFGSPDITSYLGLGLILTSSLLWALGTVHMRKIQDIDMPSMTAFSAILAAPVTALMSITLESNHVQELMTANWVKLGGVLGYQIILMSLMMYLWKELMSRNAVQLVTAFTLLQPAVAVVAAHYMLGETLSKEAIIGGGLAMIGVSIIVLRKIQKRETESLKSFLRSDLQE